MIASSNIWFASFGTWRVQSQEVVCLTGPTGFSRLESFPAGAPSPFPATGRWGVQFDFKPSAAFWNAKTFKMRVLNGTGDYTPALQWAASGDVSTHRLVATLTCRTATANFTVAVPVGEWTTCNIEWRAAGWYMTILGQSIGPVDLDTYNPATAEKFHLDSQTVLNDSTEIVRFRNLSVYKVLT